MEKLMSALDNKNSVSNEEILVRELLELCSKRIISTENYKLGNLAKFNYKIFKLAYDELFKENLEDMQLIKDMIKVEFLSENLKFTSAYEEDDDEIY